ncbi:sensor histidine kinase [Cohnella sp. GCM10027633]|uniref:cache domain-containing sensor histidine kinase n=1 Tax=unclassified Cohnella TaxID=2636738 RepID=UPI00362DA2B6
MIQWVQKSLMAKLILLFTGIIVVIVTSMGLYSYYEISKTIKQDIVRFSSQVLKQANLNLERYYREYEQGFLLLGTSQEFEDWLELEPGDKGALFSNLSLIQQNYIAPFQFRHPEILSVTLKSDRGNEIHQTKQYGLKLGYSLSEEPWLKDVDRTNKVYMRVGINSHYLNESGAPEPRMVMTMAKRFGTFSSKGYLKMDISLGPAQSILNELELGEDSIGMISDTSGTIIVHPDLNEINAKLEPSWISEIYGHDRGSFFVERTEDMVVYETIPYTNWKSIAIVSYPTVAGSVDRLKVVTILVAIGGIVGAVLLILTVTTSVTRRIADLRRMMKRIKIGDFEQRVQIRGKDELADLGVSYNQMLNTLDDSIQQLAETRMRQQQAVLSALQSQINSHFLYNTLESINSMAILADHEDIERTTVNLSNMLRYTSTYKDAIVTVNDEINHMVSYLNICRIRYGDNVSYSIRMDPDCGQIACLKAILQPIAENAIKHGLETSGASIRLSVDVTRHQDQLSISIEDDGVGFGEEELRRLREKLQDVGVRENYDQFTQVGISNVLYRLRTYYKNKNGQANLLIENARPSGAIVTLTFPVTEKEEKGDRP